MTTIQQAWCVIVQFEGRHEFRFGTIWVRHGAPMHERDTATWQAIDSVFPSRPMIKNYLLGQIVFIEEER